MTIKISIPAVSINDDFDRINDYREELRFNPGGIYAFYDDVGSCLYVGKSKNLFSRLRDHRRSEFADDIDTVNVIFVDNPSDRDIYETYAIRLFAPLHNKDKVHVAPVARSVTARINYLYAELELVKTLKEDAEVAVFDATLTMQEPNRRRQNNFDSNDENMSHAFEDYLDAVNDYNANLPEFTDNVRDAEDKLTEILGEESEILSEIERLYEELAI